MARGFLFGLMIKTLIGQKQNMTHIYDNSGKWIPVTRLVLGPCQVIQVKNKDADGYQAVQLGFGAQRRSTQPMTGHLKKSGLKMAPRLIREVAELSGEAKVGDTIKVSDVFFVGDKVNVSGFIRGRGFTGVIKRWGFTGGPKTHGQSDRHRAPGSIGQGTTPGRVYPGKKMAGRYGNSKKTIKNLMAVKIDAEKNELWVKGAVPGHPGGFVSAIVVSPALRPETEAK